MFDSLPYRNDAAIVLRRLIRSLPTRRGVLGVATCDKGLPAMMMALAGMPRSSQRPRARRRHAPADRGRRRRQSPDHRRALRPRRNQLCKKPPRWVAAPAHRPAAAASSSAPPPPRRSSREALGMSLPHSALAPSGQPIWLDMATPFRPRRSCARAPRPSYPATSSPTPPSATRWSSTPPSAAPPTCSCTSPPSPTPPDFAAPPSTTGPRQPPGAAPRRRPAQRPAQSSHRAGLPRRRRPRSHAAPAPRSACSIPASSPSPAKHSAKSSTGGRHRERRTYLRELLQMLDGIDPDDVIMPRPSRAPRGLTTTVCFPIGNLAPEGSVIKSTSIDPTVVDADGVYRKTGPARVFTSETRRHRRHQGRRNRRRRHPRAHVPRPHGLRHGRDLPDHLRPQASRLRQARRVITDAASAASPPAPASATSLPKPSPAARSAKSAKAT